MKPRRFSTSRVRLFLQITVGCWIMLGFETRAADPPLRAGAYVQDITPPFDSLLINGGFTERRRGKMNPGDLNARCFVLERGKMSIAIAVVDSCMIPRDVCDRAKALASKTTGIPPERILIAATHTHSAPSTMKYCLGTMDDPAYTEFLPPKIADGIKAAHARLVPARIGWNQVKAAGFTHCRRWITRPDKMQADPFGKASVRAMMHPGYQNPNYVGPSGPVDDELSVVSIQTMGGKPLGVLANFSMHYHGGGGPADYFGLFAERLSRRIGNGDDGPVCAMSQGTSGDLHWMDYSKANRGRDTSRYTDGLVQIAEEALESVRYHASPHLDMRQRTLTLSRRLPDAERLAWADKLLESMEGRRPKNRPEVYAEQARFIHENPTEKLVLQALRVGDLAFTAIPNEVYSITGLKLKARSPFPATFNIELANGAAGYIPPPSQHALGGYTTWPARTAGLEVGAEPKIVDALLGLFESLSGKARREPEIHHGAYAKEILAENPLAYWRCEEFEGDELADVSGNGRVGEIKGVVAYHLSGPDHASFSGKFSNRSLQLAGGTVSAPVSGARSLSFWFWNGMESNLRDNTGDLVQQGETLRLRIGGKADGGARGRLILHIGDREFEGSLQLGLRSWHQVLISWNEDTVNLYLDGNPEPEIRAKLTRNPSVLWRFGGDLPFEGRIDEIAWFERAMIGVDAKRLYAISGVTPPAQPAPPRPKFDRGGTDDYAKAVSASDPIAYWRLRDSAEDGGSRKLDATFEQHAGVVGANPSGDTFTGGRMRAVVGGVGDTYSVEFWFRNSLPNRSRPVTAYLFSRGLDGMKEAEGDHLGIGGTHAAEGCLIVYQGNRGGGLLEGRTKLETGSWHHVAMIREGDRVRVYLNGNPKPEIEGKLARTYPENHPQFFFGGRSDNFANLQGSLDEAALYGRVLSPEEIVAHYRAVELKPAGKKKVESEVGPLSSADAVKSIHVPDGFKVELVAAEPLVKDPVAIDWGADGKLWVAEMADYPSGIDGKAGGRIRYLEDDDGDGIYDKSTLFLEGVNFPAGIMSWRDGVLVAAAPDIFYAEDTDGDGKADERTVLYTGFKQGNQQLRVNGLRWGLDNWIHGANGSHHARYAAGIKISAPGSGHSFELGGSDFRIRPDEGLLEPLSGPSQFGRVRGDWGNWFGVQNSFPLWHYVLEHRYLSRNPDFAPPDPRRQLRPQNALVFPAKPPQKRFHSFNQSGRFTSACSPMIYRDSVLFGDDAIHAFTCEPFHNLVQRVILKRDGSSFTAERAEAESDLDFFASEDRWCRPVMARTGPDGALWVVDMYRYMIEHPEWLPASGKVEMKPFERKGSENGRIYRVYPSDKAPRPFARIDKASSEELVLKLAERNGTVRDIAHRLLVERKAVSVTDVLSDMARGHESALARLHALCVVDGIDRLGANLLRSALRDPHPQIRRQAVRLAELRWGQEPEFLAEAAHLAKDPDPAVRLQLACSLGESDRLEAGRALAQIMVRDADDAHIRAAVFSSAHIHFDHLARAALESGVLVDELLNIGGRRSKESLDALISRLAAPGEEGFQPGQFRSLGVWLDHSPKGITNVPKVIDAARDVLTDTEADVELRAAAIGLLGRQIDHLEADRALLAKLLAPQISGELKLSAIEALARVGGNDLPGLLFEGWPGYSPRERTRILDTLLRRNAWARACVDAVESGVIARGDIDASRRQLLLTHSDPAIRKAAAGALETGPPKERRKQIEAFRAALKLEGEVERGREVFATLCAVCHLPSGGIPMNGPDLRSITDRSREGLFRSILDPNQSVDPTYVAYTVTLSDDTALYGRILSEDSNHLTIRLLDGTDRQLLRRDIKALKNTGRSLMPEGLEAAMSPQDLADLIRFLQAFKREGR